MPPEIFQTWRAQIEPELTEARATLATTTAELRDAQQAAAAARAERLAIADVLERVARPKPLASALAVRQQGREQELRTVEGGVSRAKQALANAQARVADLEDALAQLSIISPHLEPAEPVAEAA